MTENRTGQRCNKYLCALSKSDLDMKIDLSELDVWLINTSQSQFSHLKMEILKDLTELL